jgi:hypothetical protein
MTLWQAIRRATVLVPSGPDHDPGRFHLHVVMNDPAADNQGRHKVIVVSVTSIPASNLYDASCTLFPGEHPFVRKHSFVLYARAHLADPADLEAKVRTGKYVAKPHLSEKTFKHVVQGLLESPYTTPAVLSFFERASKP